MHLAFDAKRLFHNSAGLGNYSRNLMAALMENYPNEMYSLFNPKPAKIEFQIPAGIHSETIQPSGIYKKFHSIWRSKGITKELAQIKPDLYHGLSHELPYGIEKTGVKSIVTMHDLIFVRHPEWYQKIDVKLYTKKYRHACNVADCIVAIGEQTKQDLIAYWDIDPARIEVVRQGCDARFWQTASGEKKAELQAKFNLPHQFLLQVGTLEPRKNHFNTFQALQSLKGEVSLVIVGRENAYKKELEAFIEANNLQQKVLFLHNVSNEELPALYQLAKASVYPSFFEGFGIPVLESIVSGTPVITTNKQCFKDAGGDAAVYVDAESSEELANAIEQLLADSNYYEQLKAKGEEHKLQFTNEVIAKNMMNVYQKVISK